MQWRGVSAGSRDQWRRVVHASLLALAGLLVAAPAGLSTGFDGRAAAGEPCRATITVHDRGDSGGTRDLRTALERVCDGGTVFVRRGTIVLDRGELVLAGKSVTVAMAERGWSSRTWAAAATTIDGSGATRVFRLEDGASLTLVDVVITGGESGLLLSESDAVLNGAASVTGNGTGILATGGAVTLNDSSSVSGNRGTGISGTVTAITLNGSAAIGENGGPGISMYGGRATLNNASRVEDNSSSGINVTQATVVLNNSATVRGNTSPGPGGGIDVLIGRVELNGASTVTANTAAHGGGIFAVSGWPYPDAEIVLNDESSVTGNVAGEDGGGIYLAEHANLSLGERARIADNAPNDVAP